MKRRRVRDRLTATMPLLLSLTRTSRPAGLHPGSDTPCGSIYNSQYIKGLVHVAIVGLLISILDSGSASGLEPLVSLMLAAFWRYMAFEAYHTASKRRLGQKVDDFSSLIPVRGSRFPAAPVILIASALPFC